jgi:hypothetical protein
MVQEHVIFFFFRFYNNDALGMTSIVKSRRKVNSAQLTPDVELLLNPLKR